MSHIRAPPGVGPPFNSEGSERRTLLASVPCAEREAHMGDRCGCGSRVRFGFERLGCIECGAACCPGCSYQLESAHYCGGCAERLLELPWAPPLPVRS